MNDRKFLHFYDCVYEKKPKITLARQLLYCLVSFISQKGLTQEIEMYLKDLFQVIAHDKDFEMMMAVSEQDHIHVFVSTHPKIASSYIEVFVLFQEMV